jgi:hypothetical protein
MNDCPRQNPAYGAGFLSFLFAKKRPVFCFANGTHILVHQKCPVHTLPFIMANHASTYMLIKFSQPEGLIN